MLTDIARLAYSLWLRLELWELRRWVDDFGRDVRRNGLDDHAELRHARHRAQEIRAKLATLGWPIRTAA